MFKKIILFLSFLLSFSALRAEVVNEIVIEGNRRVSEETIKVYGEINLGKDYRENDINKIINNLYSTNFFENIEIQLKNNVLKIKLEEYPVINQLIIVGEKNKGYKEQIRKLISLKDKKAFIKSELANDLDIIKQLYSSLGYNFSEVEAKVREIDKNNLDLLIEIKRGEQTKIASIKFIGNKKY